MERKLFCEIHPITYKISETKGIWLRKYRWFKERGHYASDYSETALPVMIYSHRSLIRRKLGNVDMTLQENKAVNLSLAAPKINTILIRPGETFSFWKLKGKSTEALGYKEGLMIKKGGVSKGIGGGMCQLTNLIHWMVLHSPLTITEHHHHSGFDLFPDYGRQIPFGSGTSIAYNYIDYQFKNETDNTFQLIVYTTETHLCGELRASEPLNVSYHIEEQDSYFVKEADAYYRHNQIYQRVVDKVTGNTIDNRHIKENWARVMYDPEFIPKERLKRTLDVAGS